MRKRTYLFLATCFLTLALQGCYEDNPGSGWTPGFSARYVRLDTENLTFGASSNLTQSVKVTAISTPWQFSGMDSWLKLSPASGSESVAIQAVAEENTSGDNSRTCVLTFASTASDYVLTAQMQATQNYAEPYITLSKTSIPFDGKASEAVVTVRSNIVWTASSSDPSWLTVETASDGGSITVKATENTTNAPRQATVTLMGKTTATLTVAQAVAKIEGDQATLTFGQGGGTYQLNIASDVSWTALTSQEWLQTDPSSGTAGTTQVLVSAAPNESSGKRNGWVTFNIGSTKKIEVAVEQSGLYIEADCETLQFVASEETKPLQISSSISWSLQSKPSWITLSETSGTGDKTLRVTASENPELQSRNGQIVFGASGTTMSDTVSVFQAARQFYPEMFTILHFSDKACTDTLKFETDATWTATTDDDWISVTPVKGSGDGSIAVTVTENTSDDSRTGSIIVQVGKMAKTAAVQQDGKCFTVTAGGQATIPSTGGTHTVSFNTNTSWTVRTGSSWMTATPSDGSGSCSVSFKADDNPSVNTRTDTSYIMPDNLQGIKVITMQAARYLRISHTSLNFLAKGGTSESVVVETDATYTITTEASWLKINQESGSFTVTAEPNTGSELRDGVITIAMTGLKAGESYKIDLPVKQHFEGAFFTVEQYDADESWNLEGDASAVITITGYGEDDDWNQDGNASAVITVTGYGEDDDWNQIPDNGHSYVDLGLTSGTLWATMNVGASSPEDCGDYYAWGETSGYKGGKTTFASYNYKWIDYSDFTNKLTKYCTNNIYGSTVDGKTELELDDDVACSDWGGLWHIPTSAEMTELMNECDQEWILLGNVYGRKFTSKKNSNTLFLPLTGCISGSSIAFTDISGFYWTNTLGSNGALEAVALSFSQNECATIDIVRTAGMSVRPVLSGF